MRDYKCETIEKLCAILNCLEDSGCLLGEEEDEYRAVMNEYQKMQMIERTDFNTFGSYSHRGFASYIAYSTLNDEGVRELNYMHYADDSCSADCLLRDAAEMICFSDYSDKIVEAIVIQGYKIDYVGWQPGMLFEFRDRENGEIIWSERFPQWEH